MTSTKCTATTKKGAPCTCWAVRGSDPPRCFAHHRGPHNQDGAFHEPHDLPVGEYTPNASPIGPGAPPENIDDVFADLAQTQASLSARIKNLLAAPSTAANCRELGRLFNAHSQNASCLDRLLRHRHAIVGDTTAIGIAAAIGRALDELTTEMGINPRDT